MVVREEKVYAIDIMDKTFYYSPSEGEWGRGNTAPMQENRRDWCVIYKLIYCIDRRGNLCWCEPEQLEREPDEMYRRKGRSRFGLSSSRLVHFDGRIDFIWESFKIIIGRDKKLIDLLPGARLSNSGGNIVIFWDIIEGDYLEIWFSQRFHWRDVKDPRCGAMLILSYITTRFYILFLSLSKLVSSLFNYL
ncbi:putative F-box/kelch-repeat protein [Cardamine amara subsp. amara]|uniref:F-box/kelch-repeat protein n=1 Tax=Cardamine amara subsp. amara TaxID=228776 RepID=A0ABD1BNS5_CARAN